MASFVAPFPGKRPSAGVLALSDIERCYFLRWAETGGSLGSDNPALRGCPAKGNQSNPESTERMRGGWLRKGREAWVMVQCPDAAGFERVRVDTAMPGGC